MSVRLLCFQVFLAVVSSNAITGIGGADADGAARRATRFDNFKNIYNLHGSATPFRDAAMENIVKDFYTSAGFNDFNKKTKLFYPARLADGGNDVTANIEFNLRARVPMYFGGRMFPEEVRRENYEHLLNTEYSIGKYATSLDGGKTSGMGTQPLLDLMKNSLDRQYEQSNPNPVRYSVCGPVMRFGKQTGSLEQAENRGTMMYVNHVWGINLESTDTADYARFVDREGKLSDYPAYAKTFREIIKLIFEGAAHAAETEQKVASVRIPKVSLGAFMSAVGPVVDEYGWPVIGEDGKQLVKDPAGYRFAHEVFYKSVFEFAEGYAAKGVTVVLCLRGLDEMDYELLSALNVEFENGAAIEATRRNGAPWHQNYEVLQAPPGSNVVVENNLFSLSNAPLVQHAVHGLEEFEHAGKGVITVQVNAWDSHSFMGNKQRDDPTIDGWMVAGHNKHCGEPNANTSFLQNPVFMKYRNASSNLWTAVPAPSDMDLGEFASGQGTTVDDKEASGGSDSADHDSLKSDSADHHDSTDGHDSADDHGRTTSVNSQKTGNESKATAVPAPVEVPVAPEDVGVEQPTQTPEEQAAGVINRTYREFLARKNVQAIKNEQAKHEQAAATRFQKIRRGVLARRKFAAKKAAAQTDEPEDPKEIKGAKKPQDPEVSTSDVGSHKLAPKPVPAPKTTPEKQEPKPTQKKPADADEGSCCCWFSV